MIYFVIGETPYGSHVEQMSSELKPLRKEYPNVIIYITEYMNTDDTLYGVLDYSDMNYKPWDGEEVINCYMYQGEFYESREDLPEDIDIENCLYTLYRIYKEGKIIKEWYKDGWV